jgi:UDP-N-acetylmuramoylalanine--D-glutamate ligase
MTAMTDRRPAIDPGALTPSAIADRAFAGRAVTVLGLARSGIAMARFLHDTGAQVTIYDRRPVSELRPAIAALDGRAVRLVVGPQIDPATTWADAELVTTSPSITPDFPTTEPRLRAALQDLVAARAAGDETVPALISEPDLFLRLCPAPVVGVTGTKGKTTTASLVHAILAADPGHPAVLGGNIGTPLVERLPELTPDHRVVYELSELQLPTLSRGTTVAVYTNVTADHLDRHGSLEAYQGVKRRLAELVDPGGALVLNADDAIVAGYAAVARARSIFYRRSEPTPGEVGVVDGWIVDAGVTPLPLARIAAADGPTRIMPIEELPMPGRHNVSNALAAAAVGRLFGLPPDAIRAATRDFPGVEHRLETVATLNGVVFVNDSQGTQPDAVIAALEAFEPPIVLIAGGRDKGIDLSALGPVVAQRVTAAVLMGESAQALEGLFRDAGLTAIERAPSLVAAVDRAYELARSAVTSGRPATVLLSPAAASFDMFEDYEARGRAFKDAVTALSDRRRGIDEEQGREP